MSTDADTGHYVGRFAPSPTGPLHFGSLVAAVASYLDARRHDGRWALRIDDVDRARAVNGTDTAIRRTLERHALHWDGPVVYQSARDDAYADALNRLVDTGLAFPCGCTRRELQAVATHGPAGMIYPGTCRDGLPPGKSARSWRLRAPAAPVRFDDRRLGPQHVDVATEIGDFVIRRGDGLFAYHLAMVVDDAALGATDIVRGADLLIATAPQMALRDTLGLPRPRHLHLPLALSPAGGKLSKHTHARAVDDATPSANIAAVLAFLGLAPPADLEGAPPAALLAWATGHWRIDTLSATDIPVEGR